MYVEGNIVIIYNEWFVFFYIECYLVLEGKGLVDWWYEM